MEPNRLGASLGFAAVTRGGPAPLTLPAMRAWARLVHGVLVDVVDSILPECPALAGIYEACPEPNDAGVSGVVLMRRDARLPRWVLGHELGHHLAGCEQGMLLQSDGQYHADQDCERVANAAAAMLLVPLDDVLGLWQQDWTRSQIAAYYGVPPQVVTLRGELARLLGERVDGLEERLHRAIGA